VREKGISQEALKAFACVTMLIDHIGAVFITDYTLYYVFRIIGRVAFPIYCFLMAEGAHYTKNPWKYALRLFIGMLLSEIPFDLAFHQGLTWKYQSVMVTLLLGFLAVEGIQRTNSGLLKLLIAACAFAAGQLGHTDYRGYGVLLIILFSQTRGQWWLQTVLVGLFSMTLNSATIRIFGSPVPIEVFSMAGMIPVALYHGRKISHSKALQWAFYLFYPVHLTAIVVVRYFPSRT